MDKVVLSNGVNLKQLCFGTGINGKYRYGNADSLQKIRYYARNLIKDRRQFKTDIGFSSLIDAAMKNDCCMFDTSRAYGGSEYLLGKALKKYNRNDFQIITKLRNKDQYQKDIRGAIEKSLSELGMDFVDVYLMHWPVSDYFLDSWKEMENLYRDGLCKAIGVCNCNIHHLKEIETVAEIMPMVNEIECHPLFTQNELRKYCHDKDIQIMAYTSTARMDERLKKTVLVPISNKYGVTIAQTILRWHQQIGNIPIFNSTKVDHLIANANIKGFNLTEEEIESILQININSRLRYDPDNCDFRQL
jgi:diketogulonate reductase-like aldo/keto reductase